VASIQPVNALPLNCVDARLRPVIHCFDNEFSVSFDKARLGSAAAYWQTGRLSTST